MGLYTDACLITFGDYSWNTSNSIFVYTNYTAFVVQSLSNRPSLRDAEDGAGTINHIKSVFKSLNLNSGSYYPTVLLFLPYNC